MVAILWIVTAGLSAWQFIFVVSVMEGRARWHWLDVLTLSALGVALWFGALVFSALLWLAIGGLLAFYGYQAWLGPGWLRYNQIIAIDVYRWRMYVASALVQADISIYSIR